MVESEYKGWLVRVHGGADVGVNDLGDGGAAMCALRRSQPWEAGRGGPADAGLVWWLEEDKTEETRQAVKAAGVLNNLN